MKSVKKIFDYYTSNIKQAKTEEEKASATAAWNKVYDSLSEINKLEIKAFLKQRVQTLLDGQIELDKRIIAAGLPSFEEFQVHALVS